MGDTTSIEWAANADGSPGATWNPVRARRIDAGSFHGMTGTHCVHVSEGCRNCYAERWNNRALPGAGTGLPYAKQSEAKIEIFIAEHMLAAPLRRRKPTTYFLSSMTDVFADFVTDAMLDELFAVMALAPRHTFIVLTKRADRMQAYCKRLGREQIRNLILAAERRYPLALRTIDEPSRVWPLPNVCLVVSAEDQATFNDRAALLLATPAVWRGVSIEPMIGPIDPREIDVDGFRSIFPLVGTHGCEDDDGNPMPNIPALDWIICGGESGPDARPMHPDWARALRDQCLAAGVPFFFKQWGEWNTRGHAFAARAIEGPFLLPEDDSRIEFPWGRESYAMFRIGKTRAGRLLDGVEHNARPDFRSQPEGGSLATRSTPLREG